MHENCTRWPPDEGKGEWEKRSIENTMHAICADCFVLLTLCQLDRRNLSFSRHLNIPDRTERERQKTGRERERRVAATFALCVMTRVMTRPTAVLLRCTKTVRIGRTKVKENGKNDRSGTHRDMCSLRAVRRVHGQKLRAQVENDEARCCCSVFVLYTDQ